MATLEQQVGRIHASSPNGTTGIDEFLSENQNMLLALVGAIVALLCVCSFAFCYNQRESRAVLRKAKKRRGSDSESDDDAQEHEHKEQVEGAERSAVPLGHAESSRFKLRAQASLSAGPAFRPSVVESLVSVHRYFPGDFDVRDAPLPEARLVGKRSEIEELQHGDDVMILTTKTTASLSALTKKHRKAKKRAEERRARRRKRPSILSSSQSSQSDVQS